MRGQQITYGASHLQTIKRSRQWPYCRHFGVYTLEDNTPINLHHTDTLLHTHVNTEVSWHREIYNI